MADKDFYSMLHSMSMTDLKKIFKGIVDEMDHLETLVECPSLTHGVVLTCARYMETLIKMSEMVSNEIVSRETVI